MPSDGKYGGFDAAVREFAPYPWAALNFDNPLLERLALAWPGERTDPAFLDAALREFARTDGPVLVVDVELAAVLFAVVAEPAGRPVHAAFDDEQTERRVVRSLERLDVAPVQLTRSSEAMGKTGATLVVGREAGLERRSTELLAGLADGAPVSIVMPVADDGDIASLITEATGKTMRQVARDSGWVVLHAELSPPAVAADMPEVSVGIPTYNSEDSIGKTIDSVLAQTYPNISLHISDNASTDTTRQVCLDYVRNHRRLGYYRLPENIGVFRNYNEVFRKSNSPYFKWLSSNDWIDPEFLSACVRVLESNPDVVLVYPSVRLVDDDGVGDVYDGDFSLEMDDPAERFIYLLQNIQLCNVFNGVYRTRAMQETRLNGAYRGSDGILMAELSLRGKFVLLPDALWSRRMTESTSTKLRTTEEKKQFFEGTPQNYDRRIQLKYTRALFSSVFKADIGLASKLRCLVYLCRRTLWASRELLAELRPRRH
ncbi:MAG: glycosyltransferase [Pseudomonadota bacterium]